MSTIFDMRNPSLIPSLNTVPGPWAEPGSFVDRWRVGLAWLALAVGALGPFAMAPAVRRRMLALLAPEQWAVLTVSPVLTLLLAGAAARRADRRDDLVHLGLAVKRSAQ